MTVFRLVADTLVKLMGIPLDAYKDGYNRGIDDAVHELKMLRRRM